MLNQRFLSLFSVLFILASCATLETSNLYDKNVAKDVKETGVNIFLLGDGGVPDGQNPPPAVTSMAKYFPEADTGDILLFLGDNIYPDGIPEKGSPGYANALLSLDVQTRTAQDFPGRVIFIPGNHDWYSGLDGLHEQQKRVEEALGDESFLPKDGCPLEVVEISDDLAIILVDTEWYIANWDDYPEINLECEEIDSREKFMEEFRDKLSDYQDRSIVVAMHHPLFTNGPHDGQFKNPIVPLNVLRRTTGLVWEDLQHPLYREMTNRFITILQDFEDNVIVVSGHEHNLQYIERDEVKQIVSGSGSKLNAVRQREGEFGFPGKGFAILNIDQFSDKVKYYDHEGEPIQEVLIRRKFDRNSYDIAYDFPQTITTSIYPQELYEKLPKNKLLHGERYRKYYGLEFEAPVATLDTLYGGLTPVKLGGGFQTVNLRLRDKDGKEYALRRMQKSAKQFLQREIFREEYVKDELKGSTSETFIFDFYTSAYPFATLIVDDLASAADIYHTNPKMFYIPKHNNLGEFNEEVGNELFIIEEQPSDEWGELRSFGKPDDIESTDTAIEEMFEDEENTINEKLYIRARLFDMWIGDWDRHADQFKWAQFKGEDGKDVYEPIPRDRDWAMPKYDGFILKTGTAITPSLRKMQSFTADFENVKNLNRANYKYDLTIIQKSNLEDWLKQAEHLQNSLTDEVIESAFSNVPEEAQDELAEGLKDKLRQRRSQITEWAEKYYVDLRENVVLTATHKDDFVDIFIQDDGTVDVKIYRNKDGERKDLFKDLTLDPEITEELWVYGLNDKDEFKVEGGKTKIRMNLIGGAGEDFYDLDNHKKLRVYDWASRESEYRGTIPTRDISDDYESNHFGMFKFQQNSSQLLPFFGFDPDAGLKIGAVENLNINKFSKQESTTSHRISGQYHTATKGVDIGYHGYFRDIIKNYEFELKGRYTTPAYAENFFGYGNSTEFNQDLDFNFYRVRHELMTVEPTFVRKFGRYFDDFRLSVPIDRIDVENNENRFVQDYFPSGDPQLNENFYLGADATYHFKNYDLEIDPALGLELRLNGGYKKNLSNTNDLFYFKPELTVVYPLALNDRLKLSTDIQSEMHWSDDRIPFYYASTLGGISGLRSFRNDRFTAENSFVQSTDIRYTLQSGNTFILPGNLGTYIGFDYGKVWMNEGERDEIPASDQNDDLHFSYGGGIYFTSANLFTLRTSYFHGNEGGRVMGGFGFEF